MKRTRKWIFVAQEAQRLLALGLTPRAIAKRLSVSKSTVTRWIAAGKVRKPPTSRPGPAGDRSGSVAHSAEEWAASVRRDYALDATDEQLVELATAALARARHPRTPARMQLTAMGRFQALVKQLALVTRHDEAIVAAPPAPTPPTPVQTSRQSRTDPRTILVN